MIRRLEFQAGDEHERVDQFLALKMTEFSRTRLRRAIAEGDVLLNGSPTVKGARLNPGDRVGISIPAGDRSSMTPEPIPLDILYESEELIVVNKPAGLLVHPSNSQKSGTMCNALAYHFIQNGGAAIRPGLLHRLDHGTSGVIAVAKTRRAHRIIARAFHQRRVKKQYVALVEGRVQADSGQIDAPIGRKADVWPRWGVLSDGLPAQTLYLVRHRYVANTILELEPLTGRTHQLRIHCAAMGHPIVGDRVYGNALCAAGEHAEPASHLLHAQQLSFCNPATGQEMTFIAPLPAAMLDAIHRLEAQNERKNRI